MKFCLERAFKLIVCGGGWDLDGAEGDGGSLSLIYVFVWIFNGYFFHVCKEEMFSLEFI